MIGLVSAQDAGSDFADLVHRHQSMVFSIAWHFLRDQADAEEVAQEVFMSLHRNLAQIESAAHAVSWLRKVTVQRAIDMGRRRKHRAYAQLETVPEPAAVTAPSDPMLGATLRRLVASLPETPRMVVTLRYQEDLDPAEISGILNMPAATVKSHLHRSLAMLREKLSRRGMGEK